jgi:hypothetical protein
MPTYRGSKSTGQRSWPPLLKPWHARQKRENLEYSLGYFATRDEAKDAETKFNEEWPRRKNGSG